MILKFYNFLSFKTILKYLKKMQNTIKRYPINVGLKISEDKSFLYDYLLSFPIIFIDRCRYILTIDLIILR